MMGHFCHDIPNVRNTGDKFLNRFNLIPEAHLILVDDDRNNMVPYIRAAIENVCNNEVYSEFGW